MILYGWRRRRERLQRCAEEHQAEQGVGASHSSLSCSTCARPRRALPRLQRADTNSFGGSGAAPRERVSRRAAGEVTQSLATEAVCAAHCSSTSRAGKVSQSLAARAAASAARGSSAFTPRGQARAYRPPRARRKARPCRRSSPARSGQTRSAGVLLLLASRPGPGPPLSGLRSQRPAPLRAAAPERRRPGRARRLAARPAPPPARRNRPAAACAAPRAPLPRAARSSPRAAR